jgi:hypothetical protein
MEQDQEPKLDQEQERVKMEPEIETEKNSPESRAVFDGIPIMSQVKSVYQLCTGDYQGAKETQYNFTKRCPVVSQVRSACEMFVNGDRQAATDTQVEFVDYIGETALGCLVITLTVAGAMTYKDYRKLKRDLEELHKQLQQAKITMAEYKLKLVAIKNSSTYIQGVACQLREQLKDGKDSVVQNLRRYIKNSQGEERSVTTVIKKFYKSLCPVVHLKPGEVVSDKQRKLVKKLARDLNNKNV